MSPSFWLLLIATALFGMLPVFWAWRFTLSYWSKLRSTTFNDAYQPSAAVILPLRGLDPSLVPCLRGLLRQNYARYSVYIVVDNQCDPAWAAVQGVLAEDCQGSARVRVSALKETHHACSLKVSSQLQALAELGDEEVVCFLDADSVPASDWLASMVAPLHDRTVGAATGLRWFAPDEAGLGNLVRHLYNAGSFAQMHAFHIPWGGSLALRRDTLVRAGLPQHWSHCFCEDTATYGALRRLGLRLAFVPAATQVNREDIDFAGAKRFILRQLLCVRLHHVLWPTLLASNCANAAALTFAGIMVLAGLISGTLAWVLGFSAVLLGFSLGSMTAIFCVEWLIRRSLHERQAEVPHYPLISRYMVPAGLLAQGLGFQGLIASVFLRQIDWRGIHYAIDGPDQIRLLEYRPFSENVQRLDPSRSVV